VGGRPAGALPQQSGIQAAVAGNNVAVTDQRSLPDFEAELPELELP
jgi:hypothetical protein